MVQRIFNKGKILLYGRQSSLLAAASIIMMTVALARLLGLIRMRVLFHFFSSSEVSIFLASFKIPDFWFDVLVMASLSSAFIPTFSAYMSRRKQGLAWSLAGSVLTASLVGFLIFASIVFVFAEPLYKVVAAGFPDEDIRLIAGFARWILVGQAFFALSYVLTGVLESHRRFLAPALAPAFYNLGIIIGTVVFGGRLGLLGPVIGAILGAFLHLGIQFPIAVHLGFRFRFNTLNNPGLYKIFKLALPRFLELFVFQTRGIADLFFASHITRSAYGLLRSADMVQGALVGLFGLAIAKAALPTLSHQFAEKNTAGFRATLIASLNAILFLTLPAAVFISVLRIPIVRLAFGASRFDWSDTVQTGYTLSAFSIAVVSYALVLVLTRSFYAIHNTILPMKVSFFTTAVNIILAFFLIFILKAQVWGIALSFSVATTLQALLLFFFLWNKIRFSLRLIFIPFIKISTAALLSGTVMFFLLKIFDRSVWDRQLSFFGKLGLAFPAPLEAFVLDTRYTVNLILLTMFVGIVGVGIYILLSYFLKVQELNVVVRFIKRGVGFTSKFRGREEVITPPHTNNR